MRASKFDSAVQSVIRRAEEAARLRNQAIARNYREMAGDNLVKAGVIAVVGSQRANWRGRWCEGEKAARRATETAPRIM